MINWSDWVEREYNVYPLVTGQKTRWIEAPSEELKETQRLLLDTLLYKLEPTEYAHGFVPGRSIVTNASCHVGKKWVLTADIKNFFPSVTKAQVIDVLAPLELAPERQAIIVELATLRGHLPQGAPTSPHLANLVAGWLDIRLAAMCRRDVITYTRYADDLAFSGYEGSPHWMLSVIERTVAECGFQLARDKTHIMTANQRQMVTGLVVNEKVALPKGKRRILRSMLHRLETSEVIDLEQLKKVQGHVAMAQLVEEGR